MSNESRNEHFAIGAGHAAHETFVEEIEPSLASDHSPGAEDSRQEWVNNLRWPSHYINESMNDPNYQESLHSNLRRMGFGDTVTLRRRGAPRGPVTNASLFPDWLGKGSRGRLHEWRVPLSSIVGFGHPDEGEVFVRHPN